MPDKRLLIGLGAAILILGGSITYRLLSEDEPQQFSQVTPPEVIIDYNPPKEEEESNAVELFNEMERNFHGLVEKVFMMGDEVVASLENDLYEIEGLISSAKKDVESENYSDEGLYQKLITIQEKILAVSQKLIEIEK